ncbi:MAG: Rho termination factor N-terminal domain-containing protein [Solirubrobacterales bacterium]
MYEVKFKDDKKYSGDYGPVIFTEGIAKVENEWLASWFEGRGFEVSKVEQGYVVNDINTMTVEQLKAIAEEKGIEGFDKLKKDELIQAIKSLTDSTSDGQNAKPEGAV